MKGSVLLLLALFCALPLADCRGGRGGGGRGGGGRGGGSRGSSSRGSSSRGSSGSSSSSSRGTSTSNSQRNQYYERKSSSESKPAPPAQPPPKPSAPELPVSKPKPSAPDLASAPNQPAYNPNYGRPPAYPGGNAMPPAGPPPAYPGGNAMPPAGPPPPYPGAAQPPPYPGGPVRPPAYDFNNRQPAQTNPLGSAPYPQQPGVGNMPYPQQPNTGNVPYPRQPGVGYPQQPNTGSVPYPRQPGVGYPQQPNTGNVPYPRQPGVGYPQQPNTGSVPYPRQPGMGPNYGSSYPHGSGGVGHYPQLHGGSSYGAPPSPPYMRYSGLSSGAGFQGKPLKKKGLLGSVFSLGKPGGHYGGYPKHGGFSHKGHGMSSALYPIIPLMAARKMKPKMSFPSFPRPIMFIMPYHSHYHHGYYHSGYSYNDDYRGGCRRPFDPKHGSLQCNFTDTGVKCKAHCNEGYHYSENVTSKENECWHIGGVWRPKRNFEECKPICKEPCLNGGKCLRPDVCHCAPEYRGDFCQYSVFDCNILNITGKKSRDYSWSCRHGRNETVCSVYCRESKDPVFQLLSRKEVKCTPQGEWTVADFPKCSKEEEKENEEKEKEEKGKETEETSEPESKPTEASVESSTKE